MHELLICTHTVCIHGLLICTHTYQCTYVRSNRRVKLITISFWKPIHQQEYSSLPHNRFELFPACSVVVGSDTLDLPPTRCNITTCCHSDIQLQLKISSGKQDLGAKATMPIGWTTNVQYNTLVGMYVCTCIPVLGWLVDQSRSQLVTTYAYNMHW